MRVLIAEPDDALLDAYRDFLSRHGFEVATAETVALCREKLQDTLVDLLVIEPEIAEHCATKRQELNAAAKRAGVPIVVLTRSDDASQGLAPEVPVVCRFVKPVAMSEVTQLIRGVLQQRAKHCQQSTG